VLTVVKKVEGRIVTICIAGEHQWSHNPADWRSTAAYQRSIILTYHSAVGKSFIITMS